MSVSNYYRVLGVSRTASESEIKSAYKRLAKELHPDRNPGADAEEKFAAVGEAFSVLSDSKKRKLYDEFGEAGLRPGFDPGRYRQAQSFGGFGGQPGGFHFDDLFRARGAASGGRTAGRPGRDVEANVELSFIEALRGVERKVRLRIGDQTRVVKVRVPEGAKKGDRLRIRGKGSPGRRGGPPGDLLLSVEVRSHSDMRYAGDHLEMDLPLTPLEAAEGTVVDVELPAGSRKVTIPAGSLKGGKLRLRGQGPKRSGRRCDVLLVLQVVLPTTINDAVLEAARTLTEALGDTNVRAVKPGSA